MILAGGFGTRLRSVVSDLPKPMAPIAGKPFLAHLLSYWRAQGVRRFVLSVGYLHEKIIDYFGLSFEGCDIQYVVEHSPLGTGGAIIECVNQAHLSESFVLLNGDTFFAVDLNGLREFAAELDSDWTLSLFESADRQRFSPVTFDNDYRVLSFNDANPSPNHTDIFWVNGGVYWVNPRSIRVRSVNSPHSLESELLPALITTGRAVHGRPCAASFIDIGLPADYDRAQRMSLFSVGEQNEDNRL